MACSQHHNGALAKKKALRQYDKKLIVKKLKPSIGKCDVILKEHCDSYLMACGLRGNFLPGSNLGNSAISYIPFRKFHLRNNIISRNNNNINAPNSTPKLEYETQSRPSVKLQFPEKFQTLG